MSTLRTPESAEAAVPFLDDWSELSSFGSVDGTGGVDRQAGTAADGAQRAWLEGLLAAHGFSVHRDRIGNQFGLFEIVPGAPFVLTGSHLDSQPTAGRFDGAYGVLASAHACITLAEQWRASGHTPSFNLAVVNWFNEEGSRFKPSMMGSSVFTGKIPLDVALATSDRAGVTVAEAMTALGELGEHDVFGPSSDRRIASYAELHVQQGRSMEEDGLTIGLVDATWGARKLALRVIGDQAHSGSTRMEDRCDAMLGAARLIVAARELADQFERGKLHTACGELNVYPNSPVVVASEVELLIDLRSPSAEVLADAYASILRTIAQVQEDDQVRVEIMSEHSWARDPYPEAGVMLAGHVAEELGLRHGRVMTVAGHDSTNLKDMVPTVMLFVPSVQGISHNVREFTRDEDLLAGLRQLTGILRRLSAGALVS